MNKYFLFIILKYKYKMNFNLILIICIIIIIICIIIINNKYENYENETNNTKSSTLDALNNITDMINKDGITSKNITNTNTIKTSNVELKMKDKDEFVDILDLIYPIGSIYITTSETNANKFLNCKNWKWEKYKENYYLKTSNKNLGKPEGDNKLKVENLPNHGHNIYSWEIGEAGGTYRHIPVVSGGNHGGWSDTRNFGRTRDILNEKNETFTQQPYYPASINIICYKRIE